MVWQKRRIYTPELMRKYNIYSHSQSPVPIVLENWIRIFFL